jgi:hypothetical protein
MKDIGSPGAFRPRAATVAEPELLIDRGFPGRLACRTLPTENLVIDRP